MGRGLQDHQAWQQVELHGLSRNREGPGDRGLRRDHRGGRCQHDQQGQRARGNQREERLLHRPGRCEQKRALAEKSVQEFLAGKQVRKVIVVPGKLVNIVAN